jgi:alkylated DNA repair dioxygenase AlkB
MLRIVLAQDAWLDLEPQWLACADADRLLAALREELRWEQREIVLYGRRLLQPRLIAWAGELPYRYSGQTLEPRPPTPALQEVQGSVRQQAGVPFNHVLVNRYRDGRDSMGLHADNEPELGADPVVATVSLGVARRFVLHPRRPGERHSRDLGHGSLLVMGGRCQALFRHGIPRQPAVEGERVSLTFRWLKSAPGGEPSRPAEHQDSPLHATKEKTS